MAVSIKDHETDRLARALAGATGESITAAIRRTQERAAALPVFDRRSADATIGYDVDGVPR